MSFLKRKKSHLWPNWKGNVFPVIKNYDHADDQSQWFDKIRTMATEMGYAAKPKDFKIHPEEYKGHVGHVSTVIRIALMGRAQSPDVWEIQQILGEEKTRERIANYK